MDRHTLAIVDDHALVRAGVRALVEHIGGYRIVGEGGSGDDAIELARQERPQLMLLDVEMPGRTGVEALPLIREASPDTRVLVLSVSDAHETVMACLRAGAWGFMRKDMEADELSLALRSLVMGRHYLSPSVSSPLVEQALSGQVPAAGGQEAPTCLLTPRQIEVLKSIAAGRSVKEIAFDLGLSVKTVETHRAQIMERLGVRDVPRLVLYAVRHGLVSAGEQET